MTNKEAACLFEASPFVQKPTFCCITLSTECILKCKMCYLWKHLSVQAAQEPKLEEWFRFIELLGDLTDNHIEINIGGGEPLLIENNMALIRHSAKRGLRTSMPSNGFLIDQELACKIADSGLNAVAISLDGMNKETHDFMRGVEGCHEKALGAIALLGQDCKRLILRVQSIICEKNLNEIVSLVEWVNKEQGIESITLQAIVQPFNTPIDNEWYRGNEFGFLWPQDLQRVGVVINELVRLKRAGNKIANSIAQLEDFRKYFEDPQAFAERHICSMDSWLNINRFGDVFLCGFKAPVGNIKTATPQDIWFSAEADTRRLQMRQCRVKCQSLVNCCYREA